MKRTRRYHVYKTQLVHEYLGVFEFNGNIHEAKRAAEKYFDVKRFIIGLCEKCKRAAIFASWPHVSLNEITDAAPARKNNEG
jgi:hypothetical protein